MQQRYNSNPIQVVKMKNRDISIFSVAGDNIDAGVVEDFGNEWLKFKDYSEEEIRSAGDMYFDILNDKIINKQTYGLDIGCGTGRWTKYLSAKAGFIEAIDPSNAVYAADHLLEGVSNVRITKASVETIPFEDETFDFAMSIGVLHHIPNTQKAMADCVKKVKKGGYFFCYLYYAHDNKNFLYKSLFNLSDGVRKVVSNMPGNLKRITCDVLAVTLYMPFVLIGKFMKRLGMQKQAKKLPLTDYTDKSFFIIRNDALDRFGTTLEQRFTRDQVIELMEASGLTNIVVSPNSPYYHAVGEKN